jgi:hypothetical protein
MKTRLSIFVLLVFLSGCIPERNERQQSKALQREMRSKKLKRLSQSEIMAACNQEGKLLADQLATILVVDRHFACDSLTLTGMVTSPILIEYDFVCNEQKDLPEKTKLVWDAYRESANKREPLADNLQKIGNDQMLYTSPVQFEGHFLGMWAILMDKREIIKLM